MVINKCKIGGNMKTIEDITKYIFLENEIEKADIIFIPGLFYHLESIVHLEGVFQVLGLNKIYIIKTMIQNGHFLKMFY